MKIVLVMDQFDNSNNGTTITSRRLAENLIKHGHEVTVLAGGEPREGKVCAKKHKIPFFQKVIEMQGMCFAKPDPKLYYEAFKDADIAHFFLPFRFCREGERYARQMRVPCVAGFHCQPENITSTLFLEKIKPVNTWLYNWFYRRFYNRFDYIHCPSKFIAGQLEQHGYGAEICVISNGVAREFVRMDVPREGKLKDTINIIMIGRFSREKRQDLIIEAARRSKYADRIQLIFAGKGPREKKYRKLSKGLKNPPIFRFFKQDELLRTINMCDLYIHASDAEIEGISCLEAMACGLVPVISDSKLSATGQFALHENSLFKAGDAGDLATKVDFWIENEALKREYSERYIEQQDNNRVDICVRQMEDMYRSAINKVRISGYRRPRAGLMSRLFAPNPEKINNNLHARTIGQPMRTRRSARIISGVLYPFSRLWFGLRVEGRENIAKLKGSAVTVSNHIHHIDCAMIKSAVGRRMWLVSLRDNFKIPFIGHLIKGLGAVCLGNTPGEQRELARALVMRLSQGDMVHFYAEGMRLQYHDDLRRLHPGGFALAVRAGCPVVPVALTLRRGRGLWRLKRKPCITLSILPPVYPNASLPYKMARRDLQQRVEIALLGKINPERARELQRMHA